MAERNYTNSKKVYSGYADDNHLGFAHPLHQRTRYAGLLRHVNITDKSLLDFGCGHGELYTTLIAMGEQPASYHGVDLLDVNIDRAKQRLEQYHRVSLERAGIRFSNEADDEYDIVCCLSVLSVSEGEETVKLWRDTLESLWAKTKRTLVFDLLRVEKGFPHPGHVRLEAETIADWASDMSANHLIDNTLGDHFSLVVIHREPTATRRFWNLKDGPAR